MLNKGELINAAKKLGYDIKLNSSNPGIFIGVTYSTWDDVLTKLFGQDLKAIESDDNESQ